MKHMIKIAVLFLIAAGLVAGCMRRDNPTRPSDPEKGLVSQGAHQYNGLNAANAVWSTFQSRWVSAYWPVGYDAAAGPRYPVLYLLPGFDGEPSFYYLYGNETYYNSSAVAAIADELIATGEIKPLVIIMPDASIYYGGAFYGNSALAGQWENMMAVELVSYADATFRTLVDKESRALGGHSSGGYGAIRIAMKYPDVFNSISAIDAPLAFEHGNMNQLFQSYLAESGITSQAGYDNADTTAFRVLGKEYMVLLYSMAATFSPADAKGTSKFGQLQIHLPFNYQGQLDQSIWNLWLDNDLYSWLDNATYAANLNNQNLHLEHSDRDIYFFNLQTEAFIEKLHDLNINHSDASFSTYEGGDEHARAYLYDRIAGILKFHDQYLKDRNGNF